MGRAGAGGYATVQHAYDTRLKRDVAIKCIKITQSDVARAKMSIHDAQMENASIPLLGGLGRTSRGSGNDAEANDRAVGAASSTSGFVPLSLEIGEPAFFAARDRHAEKRAKRRELARMSARPGVDAQRLHGASEDGRRASAVVNVGLPGSSASSASPVVPSSRVVDDSASLDLGEFAGYSSFKPLSSPSNSSSGASSSAASFTRRALSSKEASKNSFTLTSLASGLPGMIAGAGRADIERVGENSISLVSSADVPMRESSRASDLDAQSGSTVHEWASGPGSRADSAHGDAAARLDDLPGAAGSSYASGQRDEGEPTLGFGLGVLTAVPSKSGSRQSGSGLHASDDARVPGLFADAESKGASRARTGDPLAGIDSFPGLEEARTVAHLNDVNIVTVYDCVIDGDMAYVIMEYVEGKTLARIMRDLGNDITLDMIANVFNSISHALEVAHKENVLHLDIKPENVIVNKEGVVKVTDFGLSTLMDATGHGHTGGGTIGYMPLEQMRQQRLDVRTDEWALASLTYEMLTGKNHFKARSLRDAEAAIEGAELPLPSIYWDAIDQRVDDIMFDALSPEMDGRYSSIEELSDELSPLLGDARAGKAQLAAAVKDAEPTFGESREERVREAAPYVPFIDKLGVRGSNIFMRVFSALGVAMVAVIAMLNFKMPSSAASVAADVSQGALQADGVAAFGLFQSAALVAWIVLIAFVVLGALLPRFAMLAVYLALSVVLLLNQAWILGLLLMLAVCSWWWMFGRQSDMACTLVVMQPLFGSVGFSAVVAVVSGALLDVRDALLTILMVAASAMAFASLGSCDVGNWGVMGNFMVAINPEIAGASIMDGFVSTLSSPQNWCMMAGWVAGAAAYSWICRRGTHAFDVLASVACGALIVAGTIAVPLATGQPSMLTPIDISGIVVAAVVGMVLALLSVPDRVRMAPGEW